MDSQLKVAVRETSVAPCVGAVSGKLTSKVSLAVPLLPRLEVSSPVVLGKLPRVLLVTSTVIVAVAPAAMLPPV